jgi:hypothetical protein
MTEIYSDNSGKEAAKEMTTVVKNSRELLTNKKLTEYGRNTINL